MTKLRALGAALIALLAAPAVASAAEAKKIGANEEVTKAMFVLIFALIAILAIIAIWEARRGDH
jgi:hypothetical protein